MHFSKLVCVSQRCAYICVDNKYVCIRDLFHIIYMWCERVYVYIAAIAAAAAVVAIAGIVMKS